ncbi:MAG: hypothetical protein RLZZ59_215 [Pseudomonadota bacterium]|jgi:tetratricopeptide (TPR) repeat protein
MGACFSCVERDIEVDIPNRLNSAFKKLYKGDVSSSEQFARLGLEALQNKQFEYAVEASIGLYLSRQYDDKETALNFLRNSYADLRKENLIKCYIAIAKGDNDTAVFKEILGYEFVNDIATTDIENSAPGAGSFTNDLAIAISYFHNKQFDDALSFCERILERDDIYKYRSIQINLLKAQILFEKSDYTETNLTLEEMPSKFHNYPEIQILKSKIAFYLGDVDEALSVSTSLSQKYPNSVIINDLHKTFSSEDLGVNEAKELGSFSITESEI